MWILYEFFYVLGFILYLPTALWRRRLPAPGWRMRLGRYPDAVRQRWQRARPLWLHAVSVGETLASQPLQRAFRQAYPDVPLVVSTITPSGFSVAAKQADHDATIYFPLDLRVCIRRALAQVQPRLLLLMESELWPMMVRQTHAAGIPIAVVNGRISPRAFRRYRLLRPWVKPFLQRIDLFLMQSQADAERIVQLGAAPATVHVVGSLKWDASLGTRPTHEALEEVATRIRLNREDLIIVAGSTHRGEEDAILQAFCELRAVGQNLRLILAPRHLERLAEVEALIRRMGLTSVRLSQPVTEPWGVGLVDTFGQLPTYYGLADVTFIGGSLIPHGGQNPLEPASLGKPVVFGPFMHNFSDIAAQLVTYQAAQQLSSPAELCQVLHELLTDHRLASAMGRRAQDLVEKSRGTTRRTLDALRNLIAS